VTTRQNNKGVVEIRIEILQTLLSGMIVTIEVFIVAVILTFITAFIAGFGRLSRFAIIRKVTTVYVEIFRGTSLLVQLFWIFFCIPLFGINLTPFEAAVIAMGLNYGAYSSEIVRSSILAIPKGQTEAAIALNLTRGQRMRRVILPQAIRLMLPGFGNISIEVLKGTSLVSFITLADLTFKANALITFDISLRDDIYATLLILYFVIALPLILLTRWLERRASVGGA
jgi:polar amino acid transport system permease protein